MARGGGLFSKGGGILIQDIQGLGIIPTDWEVQESEYIEGADKIQVLVNPVKVGCYLRVEFSIDEINWYRNSGSSYSGSDEIFIPTDFKIENNLPIAVDLPVWTKYMRISIKRV